MRPLRFSILFDVEGTGPLAVRSSSRYVKSVPALQSATRPRFAFLSLSCLKRRPSSARPLRTPPVVRAPPVEARHPFRRLLVARNAHEVLRDGVKVDPRLRLQPGGGASFDLAEGMEGAPLEARIRPCGAPGPLDAPASVAGKDIGRRYARHEACPVPGVLAPGKMAAYDMVVRAGNEHDAFPHQPDAVHVDDMVDLVANRDDGPEAPERCRLIAERARGHFQL